MASDKGVSRRQFLSTTAAATSAVLIQSKIARAAASGDEVRVGMIGIGGRGGQVLEQIALVPGVRITALCDLVEKRAHIARAKLAETHVEQYAQQKPAVFTDYHKLLDYKELDAIFVETPCHLHREMAIAVIKSGRHCYSEKPMAITVADVNAVHKAAKKAKTVYQVGTQLRYAHPWKSSIEAIVKGVIGKPILIRAHRHNAGDMPHSRPWFFDRKLSGDSICEQAVHEFDIFNAIMQGMPQRATGFGGQALLFEPKGRNINDHYSLSLEYAKNQSVAYSHSWIAPPGIPSDGRRELVYGEKGAIDVETGKVYLREGENKIFDVEPGPQGDSTLLAVTDFVRCIREGDTPIANADAGRAAALVALLGLKALDEGRVVTMKELLA